MDASKQIELILNNAMGCKGYPRARVKRLRDGAQDEPGYWTYSFTTDGHYWLPLGKKTDAIDGAWLAGHAWQMGYCAAMRDGDDAAESEQ